MLLLYTIKKTDEANKTDKVKKMKRMKRIKKDQTKYWVAQLLHPFSPTSSVLYA